MADSNPILIWNTLHISKYTVVYAYINLGIYTITNIQNPKIGKF